MFTLKRHYLQWLLLVSLIMGIDQLSKILVLENLYSGENIVIHPLFNLVLVFNRGAAFSFLADQSGWQHYFFSAFALLVSVILLRLLYQHRRQSTTAFPLSLILGGALGNVIDRLRLGHVVDFIDIHWKNYHWPAFNIADSAICFGALLILWSCLRSQSKSKHANTAKSTLPDA